eukprot:s3633_g2.t1
MQDDTDKPKEDEVHREPAKPGLGKRISVTPSSMSDEEEESEDTEDPGPSYGSRDLLPRDVRDHTPGATGALPLLCLSKNQYDPSSKAVGPLHRVAQSNEKLDQILREGHIYTGGCSEAITLINALIQINSGWTKAPEQELQEVIVDCPGLGGAALDLEQVPHLTLSGKKVDNTVVYGPTLTPVDQHTAEELRQNAKQYKDNPKEEVTDQSLGVQQFSVPVLFLPQQRREVAAVGNTQAKTSISDA